MNLLEAESINTYYGDSHILFDVSLEVKENEVVALLGRNGAGKSTLLKTLAGALTAKSGQITFAGTPIHQMPAHLIARLGLQLVPEERRVFGGITVHENLKLAAMTAKKPLSFSEIYRTFPRLDERRDNKGRELSGGEQQMVAIARAMIRDARLILLDEPFEGLAPLIVRDLMNVCQDLARQGRTIVVVEQNVAAALSMADRCYLLNTGHIVFGGSSDELQGKPEIMNRYLGAAA
ncbi:ABC transporter ATP-binding protein [Pusillimonas sp. MFBS29]|uniref:ABC transporter ATP-binding protein n=1 Tax=Pusillimonas sp. MFBS29 TaxID=2886690 RepID=UPI001D0F52AD|nr:ABC transporter ATP-binding protein [Pusillimonas sp. MFBS29]MCC2597350.1 ABC transporter ATP-binding protein [Pusillimonas sp. MFBS29]